MMTTMKEKMTLISCVATGFGSVFKIYKDVTIFNIYVAMALNLSSTCF